MSVTVEQNTLSDASAQAMIRPCESLCQLIADIPRRTQDIVLYSQTGSVDTADHSALAHSLAHRFVLTHAPNLAEQLGYGKSSLATEIATGINPETHQTINANATPITLCASSTNILIQYNDTKSNDDILQMLQSRAEHTIAETTFNELFDNEAPAWRIWHGRTDDESDDSEAENNVPATRSLRRSADASANPPTTYYTVR